MNKSIKKIRRNILIQKLSGDWEPLNYDKLKRSLERTGAHPHQIQNIIDSVEKKAHAGMTTSQIYKIAFNVLKKEKTTSVYKYRLKNALLDLGPGGFSFEKLVGKLFEAKGYIYETNLFIDGKCVSHEVDIRAKKPKHTLLAECKYKSNPGNKTDIKTALYIYARSLDLKSNGNKFDDFWLITNTKFTGDAIKYAQCMGLKILGWDFPNGNGLREQLDQHQILPITCLTALNKHQINILFKENIITCDDLLKNWTVVEKLNLHRKARKLLDEEVKLLG